MKKLVAVAAAVFAVMAAACSGKGTAGGEAGSRSDTLAYYMGRVMGVRLVADMEAADNFLLDKEVFLTSMEKSLSMSNDEARQLYEKLQAEEKNAPMKRKVQIDNEASGLYVGHSMMSYINECNSKSGDTLSMEKFMAGFKEVLMMDSMPNVSKEKAYLEGFMEKVGQGNAEERAAGNRNYVAGVSYLKKEMTADPTIKKTASGLAYKVIREGKGAKLQESQVARVHYVGKHIDGTVFDSSRQRGQVAEFAPSDVISGFKEGLLMMNPGSVYRFYIPGSLGYGEKGVPGGQIGPNEMLVFEVELLGIK